MNNRIKGFGKLEFATAEKLGLGIFDPVGLKMDRDDETKRDIPDGYRAHMVIHLDKTIMVPEWIIKKRLEEATSPESLAWIKDARRLVRLLGGVNFHSDDYLHYDIAGKWKDKLVSLFPAKLVEALDQQRAFKFIRLMLASSSPAENYNADMLYLWVETDDRINHPVGFLMGFADKLNKWLAAVA